MQCFDTILDVIGGSPLIKVRSMSNGFSGTVLAKMESMNPGHSAKDRIAHFIIAKAEEERYNSTWRNNYRIQLRKYWI